MKRGFVEVVNRCGGSYFGCHFKACAEWDLVRETGHGRDQRAAGCGADCFNKWSG